MRFAENPLSPIFVNEPFSRFDDTGYETVYYPGWLNNAYENEPELLTSLEIGVVTEALPAAEGFYIASEELKYGEGGFYIEATYAPTSPSVPVEIAPFVAIGITAYQNSRENLANGSSVEAAQAYIDTLSDPELSAYYHKATFIYRNDAEIERLRGYLSWTPEQMDFFFANASLWPLQA